MNDLITALQILSSYCNKDTSKFPTHCEHDVMYITCVKPQDVSEKDLQTLELLGFSPSKDIEGFRSFRFGSS